MNLSEARVASSGRYGYAPVCLACRRDIDPVSAGRPLLQCSRRSSSPISAALPKRHGTDRCMMLLSQEQPTPRTQRHTTRKGLRYGAKPGAPAAALAAAIAYGLGGERSPCDVASDVNDTRSPRSMTTLLRGYSRRREADGDIPNRATSTVRVIPCHPCRAGAVRYGSSGRANRQTGRSPSGIIIVSREFARLAENERAERRPTRLLG